MTTIFTARRSHDPSIRRYFLLPCTSLNPNDESQPKARAFTTEFSGTLITTDWVLTELADGLSGGRTRRTVIEFIRYLRGDPAVRIVPATHKLLDRGWALFCSRPDKQWSLTDCISFIVMRERRIRDALTGDRHFEQAGFRAILK